MDGLWFGRTQPITSLGTVKTDNAAFNDSNTLLVRLCSDKPCRCQSRQYFSNNNYKHNFTAGQLRTGITSWRCHLASVKRISWRKDEIRVQDKQHQTWTQKKRWTFKCLFSDQDQSWRSTNVTTNSSFQVGKHSTLWPQRTSTHDLVIQNLPARFTQSLLTSSVRLGQLKLALPSYQAELGQSLEPIIIRSLIVDSWQCFIFRLGCLTHTICRHSG